MSRKALSLFFLALLTSPALAQIEFEVTAASIDDRKAVFGTVQSTDIIAARARIGGTVNELSIDEGVPVEAGQVIAVIDDPKLTLRLVSLDASLRALEAQRDLAETELKRIQRLRASGASSQARLDEAQTNLLVLTGNHAALTAERAVLAQQMAEGAVLAPANGRVLRVAVTKGAVIMPGEPIAMIAADGYVLRIELPERHARFIKAGDEVLVGARGLDQQSAEPATTGRISLVYPELVNGRVMADVEADGLGNYFVGERTLVHVATGQRETIVIPQEFLHQRYGVTYVMVKDEGEVMVQPGQRLGEGIEVLSGLKPGDILLRP